VYSSLGCHSKLAHFIFPERLDCYRAVEEAGWWKLYSFRQTDYPKWLGLKPATTNQRFTFESGVIAGT
jgi:hypothetical protein